MSVTNWSPRPAGNAVADPTIPAVDGLSGRQVGGALRGVMAGVAALALDQGGALVSEGADNVYVVATNSGLSELKPGIEISFWADRDNTGDAFLNVDGTGPRRWLGADGLSQPGGAIQGGLLYTVIWSEALPGTARSWRTKGSPTGSGTGSTGLPGFDFSGSLLERAQYDGQPKGKVYLAVVDPDADGPLAPIWTLYLKRSNAFGDWSSGLVLKASPAQSTADAQGAAERADTSAQTATLKAATATDKAAVATDRAAVATAGANTATNQAAVATGAAETASAQAGVAVQRAQVATTQAGVATAQASIATDQAQFASQSRTAAETAQGQAAAAAAATSGDRTQTQIDRAASGLSATDAQTARSGATAAAADARAYAAQLATAVYDWSFDSAPDSSNDWSVG